MPETTYYGKVVPVGIEGDRIRNRKLVLAMDIPKMQKMYVRPNSKVTAEIVGQVLVVTIEV